MLQMLSSANTYVCREAIITTASIMTQLDPAETAKLLENDTELLSELLTSCYQLKSYLDATSPWVLAMIEAFSQQEILLSKLQNDDVVLLLERIEQSTNNFGEKAHLLLQKLSTVSDEVVPN